MINPSPTRYFAVIPAAGHGKRMGSAIPKQYLKINDHFVLEYSVQALLDAEVVEKVVIAVNSQDEFIQQLPLLSDHRVVTTIGGDTRAQSVLHGLLYLLENENINTDDWVLVHDAVRPCVLVEDIRKLIEVTETHEVGGILGLPLTDTIKQVAHGKIEQTLPRQQLWRALTPQCFRFGKLISSIENAIVQKQSITDESSALEYAGYQPVMVEGDSSNIKLTSANDLGFITDYLTKEIPCFV